MTEYLTWKEFFSRDESFTDEAIQDAADKLKHTPFRDRHSVSTKDFISSSGLHPMLRCLVVISLSKDFNRSLKRTIDSIRTDTDILITERMLHNISFKKPKPSPPSSPMLTTRTATPSTTPTHTVPSEILLTRQQSPMALEVDENEPFVFL